MAKKNKKVIKNGCTYSVCYEYIAEKSKINKIPQKFDTLTKNKIILIILGFFSYFVIPRIVKSLSLPKSTVTPFTPIIFQTRNGVTNVSKFI